MLSADSTTPQAAAQALYESDDDDAPGRQPHRRPDLARREEALIGAVTLVAAVVALVVAFLLPVEYTARATFLAPGSQQQSGSAAALAALGSLGGLAGGLGGEVARRAVRRAAEERLGAARARRSLRPEGALRRRQLRGAAQGAAELRSRRLRQEERRDRRRGRRQGPAVRRRPRQRARGRGDQAARPARRLGSAAAPRLLREAAAGDQGKPGQGRAVAAGGAGEVGRHRPRQAGRGADHRRGAGARPDHRARGAAEGAAHVGDRAEPGGDAPQLRAARPARRAGADGIEPGRRGRQRGRHAGRQDSRRPPSTTCARAAS